MVPSLAAGLDVLAVTGPAKARRTVGKSRRSVSVRVCSWSLEAERKGCGFRVVDAKEAHLPKGNR